ncbi:MAG: polyribonucleotide nucleotidyltransferase, partial [Bacteroidales bacterium]|nr:polyribonucleotide nucleotidyltransferase [Bacteroidales bacterium]
MSIKNFSTSINLSDERTISIETGKLARQADGSVVVKMGDTMILATVVASHEARENVDFMPLSVEYREKYAAAGRFPGGFFKREARPSEIEILTSRLVDRALRPLFPDNFHAETQVIITLISADKDQPPDSMAALAASSALTLSDIPFKGPISEVRVARINGEFFINPKISQLEDADLTLIVAASLDNILMVEGEMKEVGESVMLEAIKVAHEAIKFQCQAQLDLLKKVGKPNETREYEHEVNDEELFEKLKKAVYDKVYTVAGSANPDKHERSENFNAIRDEFISSLPEEEQKEKKSLINRYFHDIHKDAVRQMMLNDSKRLDGRNFNEIRPIWGEIDYLPAAHGSALFTRGETQSLTTVTLGTKLDEQVIDGVVFEGKSNFILHYNFLPFCVGEARPLRGTNRREVGHGNLALRALKQVIPDGEVNPYTIRIVSDILESNGSSSMA